MGIGNAYFGMGLANAVNNVLPEMRAAEDRRRAQALQDEQIQAWREDRANKLTQQGFENNLQTQAAARAGTAADDTHAVAQHAVGRFATDDAQRDQQFALTQKLGQGQVDMMPLQRQELMARIGASTDAHNTAALTQQLLGLNLQNQQLNMSKLTAINDLDKAHVAAQSGNDPSPYADWFNEHAPPGQRVEIKPGTKGGYDVNHFAVGSSDDGPPAIKQINQQHFPTLDDIGEEAQNLVHSDDLYKAQIHGMTSPNWIAARGEGNVPLSLNKRNGKYYTQDGQLYNGKLAPTANDVTMQMMGGQFGMSGAQPSAMQQPHPGSQFIGSALTPQQQTQATAPNTGFDVSRYIGDGTDGYQ